ncbi:MAG: chorismate mutase [Deltaproteobacteria bacterium]|nr:MAG: chorismate mutase [Deltaproteobacteria bacterium]
MMGSKGDKSDLERLRQEIDDLDNQIIHLLNQRMHLVQKIATFKRSAGKDPMDLTREQAIFRRLAKRNTGPLPWGAVKKIFGEILAASRDIQSSLGASDQRSSQGNRT